MVIRVVMNGGCFMIAIPTLLLILTMVQPLARFVSPFLARLQSYFRTETKGPTLRPVPSSYDGGSQVAAQVAPPASVGSSKATGR